MIYHSLNVYLSPKIKIIIAYHMCGLKKHLAPAGFSFFSNSKPSIAAAERFTEALKGHPVITNFTDFFCNWEFSFENGSSFFKMGVCFFENGRVFFRFFLSTWLAAVWPANPDVFLVWKDRKRTVSKTREWNEFETISKILKMVFGEGNIPKKVS